MFSTLTNVNHYARMALAQTRIQEKLSDSARSVPRRAPSQTYKSSHPAPTSSPFLPPSDHYESSALSALSLLPKKTMNTTDIAGRIARGEKVSEEERRHLEKYDPKLAMEARMANIERQRLMSQVRSCRSAQSRSGAVRQARLGVLGYKSPSLAGLTFVAIDQAEADLRRQGEL